MKKQLIYIFVGTGLLASLAYADGYNPFHSLGKTDAPPSSLAGKADGSSRTAEQIARMAVGSVQRTDANQPNGYPKLDANKNITSPLLNNTRVGGSDNGTDVSKAVVTSGRNYASPTNTTNNLSTLFSTVPKRDPDVWMSGLHNFIEYTAENTRFVRGTGRVSLSTANLTIAINKLEDLKPVFSAFSKTTNTMGLSKDTLYLPDQPDYRIPITGGKSVIETKVGFALVPGGTEIDYNGSVVARDDGNGNLIGSAGSGTVNYSTGTVSFAFNTTTASTDSIWVGIQMKGGFGTHPVPSTWWTVMDMNSNKDDSPAKIQVLNFRPRVMLVNENGCGRPTELFCDMIVSDLKNTLVDVQRIVPSISNVFPYISPNTGHFGNFDTDPYWANAKTAALNQGGFAIDMPAGFFMDNSETYRQFVVSMIQWAHKNNIVVICEITPGDPPASERDFLTDLKNVVVYLKNNSAIPNVWYIDQYFFDVSPGTDDYRSPNYSTNSILAGARWVADTVGTFDLPENKIGYMTAGDMVVGPPNTNFTGATRETLGGLFSSLGSSAFQDTDKVVITGGSVNNIWSASMKSGAVLSMGSDGTKPVPIVGDGRGSIIVDGNIVMSAGQTLQFGGAGGAGSGESVVRGQSTDRFMHVYNPYTTSSAYTGISLDNNQGRSQGTLQLDVSNNLLLTSLEHILLYAETHFSANKTFRDPDFGVLRDAKFGSKGIAVSGGTKTDKLNVSGLKGNGNAYACIDASGNLYRSARACVSK